MAQRQVAKETLAADPALAQWVMEDHLASAEEYERKAAWHREQAAKAAQYVVAS